MTDAAASESGSVFRLIYRSHSLIASDQRRSELGAIFNSARRNNKRLGVTGALVISNTSFVQALEGDESIVRDLYASITQDARHDNGATSRRRSSKDARSVVGPWPRWEWTGVRTSD